MPGPPPPAAVSLRLAFSASRKLDLPALGQGVSKALSAGQGDSPFSSSATPYDSWALPSDNFYVSVGVRIPKINHPGGRRGFDMKVLPGCLGASLQLILLGLSRSLWSLDFKKLKGGHVGLTIPLLLSPGMNRAPD